MNVKEIATRSLYTLRMTWRYWGCVRRAYHTQQPLKHITALDPLLLPVLGIEILVLDFDGVLAADGATQPLPKVQQWLDHCVRQFGTDRVFILSNQPRSERLAWFDEQYPGLRFIAGVRKKPYPDGLQAVCTQTGVPAQAILLIDDRLLTGVLAACIAQTQVMHIRQPYVEFWQRPLHEGFFKLLRAVEKLLFSL